jgi:hypothetical protein
MLIGGLQGSAGAVSTVAGQGRGKHRPLSVNEPPPPEMPTVFVPRCMLSGEGTPKASAAPLNEQTKGMVDTASEGSMHVMLEKQLEDDRSATCHKQKNANLSE